MCIAGAVTFTPEAFDSQRMEPVGILLGRITTLGKRHQGANGRGLTTRIDAPFHPTSGDRFDNSNAIAKAIGWAFSWLEILLQNFLIP
jgi:hypothetical protein